MSYKFYKVYAVKIMEVLKKYIKIYFQLVNCAFSSYLSNRLDSMGYFLGKIVRFTFFLILVISIFRFTDNLAGYSMYEVILFFLTFNLIDVGAQFLFRGVYFLKTDIIRGQFDYVLSKPVNKLFYAMSRLVDILDLISVFLIIGGIIYDVNLLMNKISVQDIILYISLVLNGMVLVFVIHAIIAALSVRFYEAENLIWLYRESMTLGRMPSEIYPDLIQVIFTFFMPVFIMIAFPVKQMLGVLDIRWALSAVLFTGFGVIFALWFWKNSLNHYSSASS